MKKTFKTPKEAIRALCKHFEEYCDDEDKDFVNYFIDGLSTVNENNGCAESLITKTRNGWQLEIF